VNGSLQTYFELPGHEQERAQLPILAELIDRYRHETPFHGQTVVFGHVLARNSLVMVEAMVAGGAEVVLSDAHDAPGARQVRADLAQLSIPVLPVDQAVQQAGLYLDVAAVLARAKAPLAAAEVTRTGVLHYLTVDVPVVSADDARSKLIEGFYGTGESFLRAWQLLRPEDPLPGKRLVTFGYGKIGRGVAFRARAGGLAVTVFDRDDGARARARGDGFAALAPGQTEAVELALERADIVIAVTGVAGAVGSSVPVEWLRQGAVLVNLGADDEYGPAFGDDEVLGGKIPPLNFHLPQPTLNRYVDAPLSAHLLALEHLVKQRASLPAGVHPLPAALDRWVIERWRMHQPTEDLTGIGPDLGLSA
jgi:adenosylhomocysteinase